MSDQVEEIKQKTDIVSIISEFINVKKAGRNFKALCPFHGEKTPSFIISPELQIFKCFGCSKSGDVFTFLQEYEGMDFYEALKYLADRVGIKLEPFKGEIKGSKEQIYQINYLANRFYSYILLNHQAGKEALNYLTKERGLDLSTIKTFQLGYSPNVPFALKKFLVGKKKIKIDDLQKAGIVYSYEGKTFDRFRGRVIFPLFDHRGNIAGFAGRILPGSNKDLAKYINSPETEVYHKSKILYGLNLVKGDIKKKDRAVIVEGELDMISTWRSGIKEVVAIKGSALTFDQLNLLSRFTGRLVLAMDADVAGNAAARRGIEIAYNQGFEVGVARLGKYKDPDEMARTEPVRLVKAIDKAEGAWDFIINQIFSKNVGEGNGEAKVKISREIIPVLHLIKDKIVQAHYIDLVSRKLNVPEEAVIQELEKRETVKSEENASQIVSLKKEKKTRRELLEERLLAICFKFAPNLLVKKHISSLFLTPLSKRIAGELKNYMKVKKEFNSSDFVNHLPSELVHGYVDLVLKEIKGFEKDDVEHKDEVELIKKELERIEVKESLRKVMEKIIKLEKVSKKKELKNVKEEYGKLTKVLSALDG